MNRKIRIAAICLAAALTAGTFSGTAVLAEDSVSITNVSYDPTRELYEQYNKVFQEHWKERQDRMWRSHSHTEVQENRHLRWQTVWKQM